MKFFSRLLISLIFLIPSFSLCQRPSIDKEKLMQLVQGGMLSGMSPDDIRAMIRQSGFSEEEIIQLAASHNVDFSRFLQQKPVTAQPVDTGFVKAPAESLHVPISVPSNPKQILSVPSFENRPDAKDLKPFGYDVFQYQPTTFEPVANAPTPSGYNVGPGDELDITIWGQTQLYYELPVGRDGYIVIPDVGKIQVESQTIDQIRQRLISRLSKVYEGLRSGKPNANTFLDVSLGKIRTIQVFVMGNAQVPGGYSMSGLSSVFTAVYYAGGPNVNGSLRNVRVVHVDGSADTVDFYNYLLFGNKASDVRLRDGDAVFIPSVGKRVAIIGTVSLAAIYELKGGEVLKDLLSMAGGLQYYAYDKRVHIERVVPFHQRAEYQKDILDLDIQFRNADEMRSSVTRLEDGDIVSVFRVGEDRQSLITITGNVRKPGKYEYSQNLTVRDLITKADGLREDTFLENATIYRVRPDLKREILSFHLERAIQGDSTQNLRLQRLDSVMVYKEEFFRPHQSVSIDGPVRFPGPFLRTEHMTVRDLIILSGGVLENADLNDIEVARVDTITHKRLSQIFHVSLPPDYWNSGSPEDMELMDFDNVSIRVRPDFSLLKTVIVSGEAKFPGTYAIQFEGERLLSLIRRFGGFKSTAYRAGIRFMRPIGQFGINHPSPDIVETQEIDTVALRYNIIKKPRLASKEVPINFEKILEDSTTLDNLVLHDGDSLIIPRDPGVVYVEGQVYVPSSVPYKKGESLSYYVKQAGGFKRDADEDNVVVVLPNGRKWEPGGFLRSSPDILSGSSVIVPLKLEEPSNTLAVLREWVTIAASTTTLAFIVWQVSK